MNENLLKLLIPKVQDSDTTSLSSLSSQPTNSIAARDLYDNVVKQLHKNQHKFNQIMAFDSAYGFELYRPKLVTSGLLRDNLNSELLEKQLDRLLEDQCKLDKELSKISFQIQQDEQLRQTETWSRMGHFSFLQTIWQRTPAVVKTDEKIDQINCKVATLKNLIKGLANSEGNTEVTQLQKYVCNSKEYHDLHRKYQQAIEKLEDKQNELNKIVGDMSSRIAELGEQNRKLKNKHAEQCDRARRKDEELLRLMQKCQQIQLEMLRKEKELKKSKQNHHEAGILQSVCKRIKFINKNEGCTVYIFCESLEADSNLHTSKTMAEIKNYLSVPNVLSNLIEGKLLNIAFPLENCKGDLIDRLHSGQSTKRRSAVDRQKMDQSRTQMMLGSQDKKRRFGRSRILLD